MKILLDTHIWIWALHDPNRLGAQTVELLDDVSNELWLSPISTWEALTLHHQGRIQIKGSLADWVARATAGKNEAPLTHEIIPTARQIDIHQDPADRFLAATAQVLDLTLLTADTRLLGLANLKSPRNR